MHAGGIDVASGRIMDGWGVRSRRQTMGDAEDPVFSEVLKPRVGG